MADSNAASSSGAKAAGAGGAAEQAAKAAPKASQGNPVFRMMGLPNFKLKLPSRNWMIFLTITGSWTAAVVYDRQQKKRVQQKWCDAVAHLSRETLPTTQMPRRLTIYLSGPPADGLMGAREHFHEYVKPILVAAAMDWDAVEGRREGDVRAQLAERIRKIRKVRGEKSTEPVEEDIETTIAAMRERAGVREWDGPQGDIVIGRNTWKEYVRGLHEGWLGPLDPPPEPAKEDAPPPAAADAAAPAGDDATPTTLDAEAAATAEKQKQEEEQKKQEEEQQQKSAKRKQPQPFISTTAYPSAPLSPNCPPELAPSAPIAFPHILGFLNTPIRMYRFLTRRHLADEIGAQVAAAVLAASRPYEVGAESQSPFAGDESMSGVAAAAGHEDADGDRYEQQRVLKEEEKEWHKSVRKEAAKKREEGKESLWCDDVVLDPRIAARMRRFVLDEETRARVKRIGEGKEGVLGAEREGEQLLE